MSICITWCRSSDQILNDLWNEYQKIFTLEQRNRIELDFRSFSYLASDWNREVELCVDYEAKFSSYSLPSISLHQPTNLGAVIHISLNDTSLELL